MELTDLYISEQDFAKAAYCMEELLLHNPHHHLYFQKYADIKYTQVRTYADIKYTQVRQRASEISRLTQVWVVLAVGTRVEHREVSGRMLDG